MGAVNLNGWESASPALTRWTKKHFYQVREDDLVWASPKMVIGELFHGPMVTIEGELPQGNVLVHPAIMSGTTCRPITHADQDRQGEKVVGIWNADAAKVAQEHMELCAQHLRGIEQRRRVSGGMLMTSSLRGSLIKDFYKQFTLDAMERGMVVVSRTQVQYCRTRFPGTPLAAAEKEVWTFKPPTLDTYDTVELRVQGLAIPIHKATDFLE